MADTTTESTLKFPFGGEFFPSKNKKMNELIILVPFYKARLLALKRHIEFLNDLGYDVFHFHLKVERDLKSLEKNLFSSREVFGLKHVWADQIEHIFNFFPQNKIVFSFSNPSASAIEAIARRHATDIKGLICDSGPSSNLFESMISYYGSEEPISFAPLRYLAAFGTTLLWSPKYKTVFHSDLEKLPEHFKILSIRGWKDKLISPQNIDNVFDPHLQLDWQRLSLPKAGHLNGLRDYPEEYIDPVKKFLFTISSPLE